MDKVSVAQRSRTMAAVRAANTSPEIAVRSLLHRLGLRFRLHDRRLPGTPDVVLARHRTVIFVHGCFWHLHGCGRTSVPTSHVEYWEAKLQRNKARDAEQGLELRRQGWRVITVWECELRDVATLRRRLARLFAGPSKASPHRAVVGERPGT